MFIGQQNISYSHSIAVLILYSTSELRQRASSLNLNKTEKSLTCLSPSLLHPKYSLLEWEFLVIGSVHNSSSLSYQAASSQHVAHGPLRLRCPRTTVQHHGVWCWAISTFATESAARVFYGDNEQRCMCNQSTKQNSSRIKWWTNDTFHASIQCNQDRHER